MLLSSLPVSYTHLDVYKRQVPINQTTAQARLTAESAQAVYRIENMDCPTEEGLIRNKLQPMPGIQTLEFNLMQRKLTVGHHLDPVIVEQALLAIGMNAVAETLPSGLSEEKMCIRDRSCRTPGSGA